MNKADFLSVYFIEELMRARAPQKDIRILRIRPLPVDNSASILVTLTAGLTDKAIGHFGLTVSYLADGVEQTQNMVMKIKPHGREIVAMLQSLAQACGGQLAQVYPSYRALTGFAHTHTRELEIYSNQSSPLFPEIFGIHIDQERETYAVLMEYLQEVDLLNSVMAPENWSDKHIRQALSQMAVWHAQHLGKALTLDPMHWIDIPSASYMSELMPLWHALLDNAAATCSDLYHPDRVNVLRKAILAVPDYWKELEILPKTLVHNDLNPRNVCFKMKDNALLFCVYDWELATYHLPQYDVVELLCFVLDKDRYHLRHEYLEFYRQTLHQLTGSYEDVQAFRRGFGLAALDFGIHRMGMYLMAHSLSPYPFLPRVVDSYFNTLEQNPC